MSILNTAEGKSIVERVTLKKVKLDIGHDLAGMYADFYLDGKKMGYFNDDGYGGETDVVFVSDAQKKIFEDFLISNNVAELMFASNWGFMKSVDKIDLHTQTEEVINDAVNLIEQNKFAKKMQKDCLDGIVFGTEKRYKKQKFILPLTKIVEKYGVGGLNSIQKQYDLIKSGLKDGERILNDNLEVLGVKL